MCGIKVWFLPSVETKKPKLESEKSGAREKEAGSALHINIKTYIN